MMSRYRDCGEDYPLRWPDERRLGASGRHVGCLLRRRADQPVMAWPGAAGSLRPRDFPRWGGLSCCAAPWPGHAVIR